MSALVRHASASEDADPAPTRCVDGVGKLAASEQQAWLHRLDERIVRAVRLALPPDEAAQQAAKVRAILRQTPVASTVLARSGPADPSV